MIGRASDYQVGRLCSLWSLWEMTVRFDAGRIFTAIVGLSNMGHSAPSLATSLLIGPENWDQIKEHIQIICDELKKIDLSLLW